MSRVFAYTEFPRTNTPLMGEKWKKLRIGKNIPLLSTNQKTAFIYKVELYTRKGKFVEREENAGTHYNGGHIG